MYIGVGIFSIFFRVMCYNIVMYLYECIVYCILLIESREIRLNLFIVIFIFYDCKGYGDWWLIY